jgi:osmoprotectant transport system permease protein
METLLGALDYALDPSHGFGRAFLTHLQLSIVALFMGTLIGLPLGILVSRSPALARISINLVGIVRVIPALALLFLLIPLLHTGFLPSVVALTVLAVPPILINTSAGMSRVDRAVIEAGRGMGMTYPQMLWKVQLPLALPIILAGFRIAAIEVIASATLASIIGGGGLGDFITAGLSRGSYEILLVGAIPVAVLSLGTELGLASLQRTVLRRQHIA